MGDSSQTIVTGYHYYVGLHFGLAQKVDRISEIRVGGRTAWIGLVESGTFDIYAPELFGGDASEGGIVAIDQSDGKYLGSGEVVFLNGDADQVQYDDFFGAPPYWQTNWAVFGEVDNRFNLPAFRGVATLIFHHAYLGTIPRFKPWAITGERYIKPEEYPGAVKFGIGWDANPAHMMYELIVSQDFGMGHPVSRIDIPSFDAAAQTLNDEGLGLSVLWAEDISIADMKASIEAHINGVLYLDPATGLWTLKLVRDDYDPETLPVLDESNIIAVSDFSRPSWAEIINQVTVRYVDGEGASPTWNPAAVSIQNLAAIQAQGNQVIDQTIEYPMVTTHHVANMIAARDLRQLSLPLARLQFTLTADHTDIRPGEVYKFSYPEYGITSMVIRIAEVNFGSLASGAITVIAAEDIFGTVVSEFADPTPTEWATPVAEPLPSPFRRMHEETYYQIARRLGDDDTQLAAIDDQSGFLVAQATRPTGLAYRYQVWVDAGGGYEFTGWRGNFCPTTTLAAAISASQTVVTFDNGANATDLNEVIPPMFCYLESELLHVVDFDYSLGEMTVERGVIDTVPVSHSSGARLFFAGTKGQFTTQVYTREYTETENISVKVLPRTGLGLLDLSLAPIDNLTFEARFFRPYPPGQIRVNGQDWPVVVTGANTLTWAHRDRTLQTGAIINQDAASIGPEPGTTYTVRIYHGVTQALLRTITDIAGTSYTYLEVDELADNGGNYLTAIIWEVEAVRDSYVSWQAQRRGSNLAGFGRNFGNYFGGI